jgi:hypothetical protein
MGLWMVPLIKIGVQATSPSATTNHAPLCISSTATVAAKIDATFSAAEYAATSTRSCAPCLLQALDLSEELATFPRHTTTLIKSHQLRSTATNKGHIQRHQANTASMRNSMQFNIIAACAQVDCMFPPQEIFAMQDMFSFAALAGAITGTIYTDITGTFPVHSFKSMQYVFVSYIYDLNAIIDRAMLSRTGASMVQEITKVISILKFSGYYPALNVMDNECSAAVKKFIWSKAINIQLIPLRNHHKKCR